jgi:hypothetical protein
MEQLWGHPLWIVARYANFVHFPSEEEKPERPTLPT